MLTALCSATIYRSLSEIANQTIKQLIVLPSLPSTNQYLLERIDFPVSVCLADQQTKGRGQFSRHWVSPPASNLYISLLWSALPQHIPSLATYVGEAIITCLKDIGVDDGLHMKCPNDILWEQRKLAGILIESKITANQAQRVSPLVIGIGLNLSMSEAAGKKIDQPWTDLTSILKMPMVQRRNSIAAQLLSQLILNLLGVS